MYYTGGNKTREIRHSEFRMMGAYGWYNCLFAGLIKAVQTVSYFENDVFSYPKILPAFWA
jgi:hypothetical protein